MRIPFTYLMGLAPMGLAGILSVICAMPMVGHRSHAAGPPPESASGRTPKVSITAKRHMVVTANKHASIAARTILRAGGSATDAAIAAQLVLTLVEPQSSGIGGGGFALHWSAINKKLNSYDGRETAPLSAHESLFLGKDGKRLPFFSVVRSGLAVGTPGLVAMLAMMHRQHGKLAWADLFGPAIKLAEKGFPVSQRLHILIRRVPSLRDLPATRRYFFTGSGKPLPVGFLRRNPAYAETLRRLRDGGPRWFYQGAAARDIVAAVRTDPRRKGLLTLKDFRRYRAIERAPVCGAFKAYRVCGMGPPSSGGVAVAQILGIYAHVNLPRLAVTAPGTPVHLHAFLESSRLAFADRNAYLGDPAFTTVPVKGLLARAYLKRRAALISGGTSMGKAKAGRPSGLPPGKKALFTPGASREYPSTTHFSIIDQWGNAVSLTSSIEFGFGAQIMVRGFLLNNQLTDFSFTPARTGRPVANRVQAGKRPRSSMSPTMVFDEKGRLRLIVGSPGGSRIIGYVAKTLWLTLDAKMPVQRAIDYPHFLNRNGPVEIEKGTRLGTIMSPLVRMGHRVYQRSMASGLHAIMIRKDGLKISGTDPRREGLALGD